VSNADLELGSDLTSYTPEIEKLAGWDEHLSLIAGEAADLQRELARLQEQSDDVARLLEQREVELERREAERAATESSISQLKVDFARAQQELAQARTSQREPRNSLQVSRAGRRAQARARPAEDSVAELEELATPSAQVPPEPQCHFASPRSPPATRSPK
jgi:chromosome segregation ATPase